MNASWHNGSGEDDYESQLNRSALWAITYGDMMSFLMVFFLILSASLSAKSVAVQISMKSLESQFGHQSRIIDELFSAYGIQKIAKLEVGKNRIRLSFASPILFAEGSATLKPASLPQLGRLADALKEIPNYVQIEGYTDNTPLGPNSRFRSNWELSAARAFSVLRAFQGDGIPPYRLSAIGYGQYRPLVANDSPAHRAANRRIEIDIIRRED